METTETASQPLRLFTQVSPEGQADSTIPVRWCVSREVVEDLKERGVKSPYLLISISNGGREVDRHLVPLMPEMTYLQFHRPGENIVHATIVWHRDGGGWENEQKLKKWFLQRESHTSYRWEVLDYEGEEFREDFDSEVGIMRYPGVTRLRVVVPDEMFAPEPPKWLKRFVGFFFDTKPVDQCHFRRRILFSVLLTPLYGLLLAAKEFAILGSLGALLFAGRRGINYRPLLNPIRCTPADTWRNARGPSFWTDTKDGNWSPLIVLHPLVIVLSFGATFIATAIWSEASFKGDKAQAQHLDHLWGGTWWIYFIGSLAPAAIGAIVILTPLLWRSAVTLVATFLGGVAMVASKTKKASLARKLFDKRRDLLVKTQKWQRARQRTRQTEARRQALEAERAFYDELETLACDGDRRADLKALPKERRTIYLRFQAVKAAVCRPYAK